ncbi:MAG: UvrD-helicase domain-containing protein, partial [Bryobacteraceae bacterium]
MNLTPLQKNALAAADPPRDTCVVAGPGSGKTTVLTESIRRLVESGIEPRRILAITFTEKATHQLR